MVTCCEIRAMFEIYLCGFLAQGIDTTTSGYTVSLKLTFLIKPQTSAFRLSVPLPTTTSAFKSESVAFVAT